MSIRWMSTEEHEKKRQELVTWLAAALLSESGYELYNLLLHVRRLIEHHPPSPPAGIDDTITG